MKKIFLSLTFIFTLISCSSDIETGLNEEHLSNNSYSTARDLCPPNTFELWEYNFDAFKFRRPRSGCTSGFWFCFVNGSWDLVGCSDQFGTIYPPVLGLQDNTGNPVARVIAEVDNAKKEIRFRFPKGLTSLSYTTTDLATFNVDDEITIGGLKLKGGDYSTTFTSTEIQVSVPCY